MTKTKKVKRARTIFDLFPAEDFEAALEGKWITVRPIVFGDEEIAIANYSDSAQFARHWDDVTVNCRGLIYDGQGRILARPWRKFFNLGEASTPVIGLDDKVEITAKMDGSLGIMYRRPGGQVAISTRGSLVSDQAKFATKLLQDCYANVINSEWVDTYTFLFEIVYPENRIVVDYGDQKDLVLLGCVEIATGHYQSPAVAKALLGWTGPVVGLMPWETINQMYAALGGGKNEEGYVIRRGNDLVKWKFPGYIELHKLIFGLSEKTVWEAISSDRSLDSLCEELPDEFHEFVKVTYNRLGMRWLLRLAELKGKFERLDSTVSRREFADAVWNDPDRSYMFLYLDKRGEDIAKAVWRELKPVGPPAAVVV